MTLAELKKWGRMAIFVILGGIAVTFLIVGWNWSTHIIRVASPATAETAPTYQSSPPAQFQPPPATEQEGELTSADTKAEEKLADEIRRR